MLGAMGHSRGTLPPFQQGSVLFMGPGFRINEDNGSLFYNNAANFFGVGTNVPESRIHAVIGSGGVVTPTAEVVALFQSDAVAGDSAAISVVAGATGIASLHLGTRTNPNRGRVSYDNTGFMSLYNNDIEQVRITGTGVRFERTGVALGPTAAVHIVEGTSDLLDASPGGVNSYFRVTQTATIVNNSQSATHDFRVRGDTFGDLIFADVSVDRVGFNIGTPSHIVHIRGGGVNPTDLLMVDDGTNQLVEVMAGATTMVVAGTSKDYGTGGALGISLWPSGLTHGAGAVGSRITGVAFTGALTYTADNLVTGVPQLFRDDHIQQNLDITVGQLPISVSFRSAPTMRNTAAGTLGTGYVGYTAQPVWSNTGGGTIGVGSLLLDSTGLSFQSAPAAVPASVTLLSFTHFSAGNMTIAGTVTNHTAFSTNINNGTTCRSFLSTGANAALSHEGQAVFGNAVAPTPSVSLEASFNGTPMAFLTKPMTFGQRDGLTATDGMLAYISSAGVHHAYRGTWVPVTWDQYTPDAGGFTVLTGRFVRHTKQLVLEGTERATLEGTARLVLAD